MDELLTLLKAVIAGTDLEFATDAQLTYALTLAYTDVENKVGKDIDAYKYNVIEGAKWYLARIGVEGETQHTENGVTRIYASMENPSWLSSIIPRVTVRPNGAAR